MSIYVQQPSATGSCCGENSKGGAEEVRDVFFAWFAHVFCLFVGLVGGF